MTMFIGISLGRSRCGEFRSAQIQASGGYMITTMQGYLTVYNVAACAGWAYLLFRLGKGINDGATTLEIWEDIGLPLMVVQSSAALEIFHSLLGLVRSPILSTTLQVLSRLMILWVYTYWAPACHAHWSLKLMVGSWCLVEVPRYLFYALNLQPAFAGKNMPLWLFTLRYSLFMVLYPTGITGEILQAFEALPWLKENYPAVSRFAHVHLLLYVPLGPFMIWNMWNMRKRAFKKRSQEEEAAKNPKKSINGLVWPVTNEKTGERSTTRTNKMIWEKALEDIDEKASLAVKKEKNWRWGYVKHVENNVRVSLKSRDNALKIAIKGLGLAHEAFEFVRDDKVTTLQQAMDGKTYTGTFETGFIKGKLSKPSSGFACTVPYKGKVLTGLDVSKQCDIWVENGTIEPSAADAIKNCVSHPEWMDLSNRYFVLLGATSAMGPLNVLLALGANVIAIDLDREHIWKGLIEKVENSCGTLTFPLSKPQSELSTNLDLAKHAGANLLTHTPEIANWLCSVQPGKDLTIGNYTYLDGALHVQLSVACDTIMQRLCQARPSTSIAFLCTPTDVHVIPKAAHDAAIENRKHAPSYQKMLEGIMLVANALDPVEESGIYIVDGIVANQGPNYILAKRLQHWRAIVAHSNGHVVSTNVAPSTATQSVVSNPQFAAAYGGFHLFKSMEVMYQETSSAVMLALLVNDLCNPRSVANPSNTLEKNPLQLFEYGSFHGGVWRCAYKINSIGVISAVYWYSKTYAVAIVGGLATVGGVIKYIVTGSPI